MNGPVKEVSQDMDRTFCLRISDTYLSKEYGEVSCANRRELNIAGIVSKSLHLQIELKLALHEHITHPLLSPPGSDLQKVPVMFA